jgi:hypothetical protein
MEPVPSHTDGTGAAPYMRPRIATNKATELLVALSFRRHIFSLVQWRGLLWIVHTQQPQLAALAIAGLGHE